MKKRNIIIGLLLCWCALITAQVTEWSPNEHKEIRSDLTTDASLVLMVWCIPCCLI